MFLICSHLDMTRFDQASLADALLTAPGWARVGLTAPTSTVREDAACELARVIIDRIERPVVHEAPQEQLPL